MAVDASKVVGYGLTGPSSGVTISKVVGYVLMYPGTEAGGPDPEPKQGYTYAQILRSPE